MVPTRAGKLPRQVQRLLRARVLKSATLSPRELAMLKKLSEAEVSALISMRRKFGGTIYKEERAIFGFGPL
jgi:hypothetical protein